MGQEGLQSPTPGLPVWKQLAHSSGTEVPGLGGCDGRACASWGWGVRRVGKLFPSFLAGSIQDQLSSMSGRTSSP